MRPRGYKVSSSTYHRSGGQRNSEHDNLEISRADIPPHADRQRFEISEWKPFVKNTLQAFFTITTASGMILHDCTYHVKNSSRWVGLPAREYMKDDGTTGYARIIEFTSREISDRFQGAALEAIDRHLGGTR